MIKTNSSKKNIYNLNCLGLMHFTEKQPQIESKDLLRAIHNL